MLIATASVFAAGVALFIIDFFRHAPRFEVSREPDPALIPRDGTRLAQAT